MMENLKAFAAPGVLDWKTLIEEQILAIRILYNIYSLLSQKNVFL